MEAPVARKGPTEVGPCKSRTPEEVRKLVSVCRSESRDVNQRTLTARGRSRDRGAVDEGALQRIDIPLQRGGDKK